MRRVTNLQLLNAVLIVILLTGLVIVLHPFDDTAKQLIFYMLVIMIGGLVVVVSSIFQWTLKNTNSIWLQPVSTRVSAILINSVVSVWLCVVGLIVFIVLKVRGGSPEFVITVIFLLLAGVGFGRFLQKRFSNNSLLPYGVSFFGALVMILVALAAIH